MVGSGTSRSHRPGSAEALTKAFTRKMVVDAGPNCRKNNRDRPQLLFALIPSHDPVGPTITHLRAIYWSCLFRDTMRDSFGTFSTRRVCTFFCRGTQYE